MLAVTTILATCYSQCSKGFIMVISPKVGEKVRKFYLPKREQILLNTNWMKSVLNEEEGNRLGVR